MTWVLLLYYFSQDCTNIVIITWFVFNERVTMSRNTFHLLHKPSPLKRRNFKTWEWDFKLSLSLKFWLCIYFFPSLHKCVCTISIRLHAITPLAATSSLSLSLLIYYLFFSRPFFCPSLFMTAILFIFFLFSIDSIFPNNSTVSPLISSSA